MDNSTDINKALRCYSSRTFYGRVSGRKVDYRTQKAVVTWLGTRGVSLTVGQLKQQCKTWGVSRRGAAADERTVEQIYRRFHTTTEDDETIAKELSSEGLSITPRQIKDLR